MHAIIETNAASLHCKLHKDTFEDYYIIPAIKFSIFTVPTLPLGHKSTALTLKKAILFYDSTIRLCNVHILHCLLTMENYRHIWVY